jgi:drug/metabolite transporter, DME family
MGQSSRMPALVSGCFAALGWGLTGTFVKLLPGFTTLEVLALRLVVAFLLTFPILLTNRPLRTQFLTLIRTPIGLGLSSLMVFYYWFAVRAFQLAPVSDVVLIIGLSPLIGLAVKAAMRKTLTVREGAGAFTAFFGLLLFVLPKFQGSFSQSTYLTGLFFAFLSACVTLGYASLFKHYASQRSLLNPISVAFTTFMLGAIAITPIAILSSPHWMLHLREPNVGWIVLGLGILSTAVPTLCYSFAAQHLSPILTTALNLLTPIFAAVIAVLLLKEQFPVLSLIGAVLIIVGILSLSLPATKENSPRLTPEEYFAWEEKQLEKHEYIDGEVYAMSGGSKNHSLISVRFITLFSNHLEESGCETGNSDLKVNIVDTNDYTYPDVSVTCDDRDKTTTQYITYPCLIVEVLSNSTEAYDRGGKFRMYRHNPILQDYLLVSSTRIEMDLYHKNNAGEWIIINYKESDTVELKSIHLSVPIEQVYRGLVLTPEGLPPEGTTPDSK